MVQKFVFDPQTLIDEEKEKEKNKVKKVLSEQEEFDKVVEEQNEKAEKLEKAIDNTLAKGLRTVDLITSRSEKSCSCKEMGEHIIQEIRSLE